MGVERFAVELLLAAKESGCPLDKVATLGRQNIYLTPSEIERFERDSGIKVEDLVVKNDDSGFADELFTRLGVQTLHTLDYSEYQGCNVVIDLNQPIPAEQEQQYDMVFDGGTLEHVFHFPNAIENCMRLLKKDGWFLSVTGSNNWNGHGFYQFTPELFYRIFSNENGFEPKIVALGECKENGGLYSVQDGQDLGHRVQMNGVSQAPLSLIFAAKRIDAKCPIFAEMPYQSDYSASWEAAKGDTAAKVDSPSTRTLGQKVVGKIRGLIGKITRFRPLPPGVTRVEKMSDCVK